MTSPAVEAQSRQADLRRQEAEEALNAIVDACSVAASVPIGLVDMGIAEVISVADGCVSVRLAPTFGGCLFVGVFAEEMDRRLRELDWCSDVHVDLVEADGVWTEDRIRGPARERLEQRRSLLRAEIARERDRA